MGTNKDQTPESKSQATYESTVLDFLDKEMAAVQPNGKRDESGQEVDALVTDLLKQVMTESDKPNGGQQAVSPSPEYILSEFEPAEAEKTPPGIQNPESPDKAASPLISRDLESPDKAASPPISRNLESPDKTVNIPTEKKPNAPAKPEKEMPAGEQFNPRIPNFGLGMAPRRKIPMIAAASVCLLAIIGAAVYYLMGSPRGAADSPEFQPTATISLVPYNVNRTAPAASQKLNEAGSPSLSPARKPAGSRQILPKPQTKSPSLPSSGSVRASTAPQGAAPETTPAPAADADLPADPVSNGDSVRLIVKPSTAQTSTPLTVASNLVIEKPAVPPMPDGIALANSALDGNPAQSVPTPLGGMENSAQTSQLQTPIPVGSRDLVPSVLISQVSPVYPELAIRSRLSGSVVLDLQINEEGKVVKATPVSGPSVFYSESVKAAMQYRYRPARLDGMNASSKSRVTMVFNLNR